MAKLISVFYYLSLLFVINLDGDPVLDVWIDEEQFHSDDLSHNLQRQRRAADSTIFEYDIILMVDVDTSQIRDVKALLDNVFSEITTSDNSANITSANVTTVCNETACSCEDGFYWNSQTCSSYSCYSVTMGETCNCIKNTSVDGICDVIPTAAPPASTLLTLITSTSPTSKTEESKGASTTTITSTMTQHISRTMATTTATTQTTVTTSSTTTKPTTLTTATTSTTTPQISRTMATTTATTQTTVTTSSTTKPTTLTTTTSQTTVTTSSTTKPTTLTTTTKQTITSTMTTKATTRSSTPEKAIQTNMYFIINDDFSDDLNDKSSDKYKSYASIINQKLNEAYRNHLPGFQTAYVTGFSKGSIRTDFIFISDEPTLDQITAANTELKESLKSYFRILSVSDKGTFEGNITIKSSADHFIYENNPFNLTCISSVNISNSKVRWIIHDKILTSDTNTVLQKTATTLYNGIFICQFYNDVLVSANGTFSITVIHQPVITAENQTFLCNTNTASVKLSCCAKSDNNSPVPPFYNVTFKFDNEELMGTQRENSISCFEVKKEFGCGKQTTVTCTFSSEYGNITPYKFEIKFIKEAVCKGEPCDCGYGAANDITERPCGGKEVGNIIYQCSGTKWQQIGSDCRSAEIVSIFTAVKELQTTRESAFVPILLSNLSAATSSITTEIQKQNIETVVSILQIASNLMESVNNSSMTNVLTAVNVLLAPNASNGWQSLNTSVSTMLLSSVENFAKLISFDTPNITIENQYVELRGQFVFNENGNKNFNETFFGSKGNVFIPRKQFETFTNSSLVISIGFESLSYILQSESNSTSNFSTGAQVNSILLTVTTNENNSTIQPTLTFEKKNKSLNNLSCVFWDLNSMKWNESGCTGTSSTNSAICDCRHLTSFSILMSMNVPPNDEALEWITHIGLGISMGSLLLCLIIEILVWKIVTRNKTSYMRHVSIVNIALSLLIADIWFIIGGQVQNQKAACTAATFFTQFFYLSLFFWMFFMGLMLFYRLILIFHDMSQSTMMLIAFMLGYGCPLAITVITVAVTEPNRNLYTGTNACWLNWKETKAILAFVIPAFFIIASNFIILFVVISRILKPSMGDRHRSQEKNTMIQVARSIAILTPLLGLTWGFGIAIVVGNSHYTFHVIFTVLNAFQGFFVLLFGTLLDSKVREALMKRIPLRNWSTQKTKTTFSAPSSGPVSRAFGIFNKRGFYSFTDPSHPSSSNYSESYSVLN